MRTYNFLSGKFPICCSIALLIYFSTEVRSCLLLAGILGFTWCGWRDIGRWKHDNLSRRRKSRPWQHEVYSADDTPEGTLHRSTNISKNGCICGWEWPLMCRVTPVCSTHKHRYMLWVISANLFTINLYSPLQPLYPLITFDILILTSEIFQFNIGFWRPNRYTLTQAYTITGTIVNISVGYNSSPDTKRISIVLTLCLSCKDDVCRSGCVYLPEPVFMTYICCLDVYDTDHVYGTEIMFIP